MLLAYYCHNLSVARVEKLPLASLRSHDYGIGYPTGSDSPHIYSRAYYKIFPNEILLP